LKPVTFFFWIFWPILTFGQLEITSPPEYIRTVVFSDSNGPQSLPIIQMGEQLLLSFDVLNNEESDYFYRITHHNADWSKSNLVVNEYLNGFDDIRISNYQNSVSTLQLYSHYLLTLPNDRTSFKKTGNYILTIFDDSDQLVFSRPFVIYEPEVNVGVVIKRSRELENINEKQVVQYAVINPQGWQNPEQTVSTSIYQNRNLDNPIIGIKHQYILGKELQYRYDEETSFWGGNEYLYFENKDIRVANNAVEYVDLQDVYHSYLYTDVPRYNQTYTYNPDINGQFVTTMFNARNPDIEADYSWVHFSLLGANNIGDSDIHVFGGFNDFIVNSETKMTYNYQRGVFETALYLKQGFYNYKYVVQNPDGTIDTSAVSGDFYQTENKYTVLVYYRPLGGRFDSVIGFGEVSSEGISN